MTLLLGLACLYLAVGMMVGEVYVKEIKKTRQPAKALAYLLLALFWPIFIFRAVRRTRT